MDPIEGYFLIKPDDLSWQKAKLMQIHFAHEDTLTVPKYGGVLVGPGTMRQVFNDGGGRALADDRRARE